jgi:hypothetical protein
VAEKAYKVRAVHCSHQAAPEESYGKLKEVTAPLSRSWEKLAKARRVGIKVNMQMHTEEIRRIGGRRQELVDDDVLRAALRAARDTGSTSSFWPD